MKREYIGHYSRYLGREMHMIIHGHTGVPLVAFPCQDGMCDNWESFGMQDTLAPFIESGAVQLFSVDTVDRESWSDVYGDKGHRAWMQECYYNYIVEEALPVIAQINSTGKAPVLTGFSLGATHAAIDFLRRPELFTGMVALSGCYDAFHFWDGWSNDILYNNSPVHFLENMPADHPYIGLYNSRRFAICVGQGAWEDEGRRTSGLLKDIFLRKNIHGWVDFWGYDVNHDWPWWRKQIWYYLPWVLGGEPGDAAAFI